MGAKVLVTGAAGFIGSNLAYRLLEEGSSVIGIDNLSTGSRENLAGLKGKIGFKFVEADVCEEIPLPRVDAIFHLASPASPPQYEARPIETLEANGIGTNRMLAQAYRSKARILISSTSEVYGDPEVHPQVESYWGNVNPIGGRSCYDEGKRFAEALAVAWQRSRGVDVRIARIFNTYGPGMAADDGRVVSNFIVAALKGNPLKVHGSGKQTRSLCYVSDMIDALMALYNAKEVEGPVNLGNPDDEVSVLELARMIIEITGSKSKIVHTGREDDDPERRRPDISKARKLLKWSPSVPISDGLSMTAEYFSGKIRLPER